MTDKETLFLYRLQQAEETLSEAEKMIKSGFSGRSIINRTYYSLFYALLALFIKTNTELKTSKHIGIISIFDKEFVKTGKFGRQYSAILHDIFDARQEGDYKELADISTDNAAPYLGKAKELLKEIKKFIELPIN